MSRLRYSMLVWKHSAREYQAVKRHGSCRESRWPSARTCVCRAKYTSTCGASPRPRAIRKRPTSGSRRCNTRSRRVRLWQGIDRKGVRDVQSLVGCDDSGRPADLADGGHAGRRRGAASADRGLSQFSRAPRAPTRSVGRPWSTKMGLSPFTVQPCQAVGPLPRPAQCSGNQPKAPGVKTAAR